MFRSDARLEGFELYCMQFESFMLVLFLHRNIFTCMTEFYMLVKLCMAKIMFVFMLNVLLLFNSFIFHLYSNISVAVYWLLKKLMSHIFSFMLDLLYIQMCVHICVRRHKNILKSYSGCPNDQSQTLSSTFLIIF